jgi:hypothetical protein
VYCPLADLILMCYMQLSDLIYCQLTHGKIRCHSQKSLCRQIIVHFTGQCVDVRALSCRPAPMEPCNLAAAGLAHGLPPPVRAVRRQHMRLPAALATGDRWGVRRRPPAACSHTRCTATPSPASLTSSSKPMATGSPSYARLQQQGEPHHSAFISSDHAAAR